MSDEATPYRPRCKHLHCNKSMLVYGEAFESDPEYQSGMAETWCLLTARASGPDGEDVSLSECSNPERSCFKEY
jgi:hypothetical protein